jgi:hypothetical protein
MPTVWTPSGTSAQTTVTYACTGTSTCACGQQDAITIVEPTPITLTNEGNGFPAIAFTYSQQLASATWTIKHNLNFYPNVTVVDSAGTICEGEINYVDQNNIILTFQSAFSGNAYLS